MSGLALERVEDDATRRNFEQIERALGVLAILDVFILDSGTPQGSVVASPGALCVVRTGGSSTTYYAKVSGSATNTGWERVQTAP